jgi:hypothetical protein
MQSVNSDSPDLEKELFDNLTTGQRKNAYMPNKKSSKNYNVPSNVSESDMNALSEEFEQPNYSANELILPVAPSGYLFPSPPKTKPKLGSKPLILPNAPTAKSKPMDRKPSTTGTKKLMLNRSKLAKKAEEQKRKHRTIREKLDALVKRFKKGGTRKRRKSSSRKLRRNKSRASRH